MAKRKASARPARSANEPNAASATGSTVAVAQPPKAASTTLSRKAQLREVAERRRRKQNVMLAVIGVVIVAVVAVIVWFNVQSNQPVVGEESFAAQGNTHIPLDTVASISYNSTPPTSGPHYGNTVRWGVHEDPVRYEYLLHNLEDGGVVVYYQCPEGCPEVVAELEEILAPYIDAGNNVILAPNDPTWRENGSQLLHQDMGATIALVAWQKLLLMEEVNADTINTFVERYEGIDHHRAF